MITAKFINCFEVRMGSPYKICRLHLTGEWTPDLEPGGWLPAQSRSCDARYLALARWNIVGNMPGFQIFLIDEKEKTVEVSQRIPGCCESLTVGENVIFWKAFPQSQGSLAIPFDNPIT